MGSPPWSRGAAARAARVVVPDVTPAPDDAAPGGPADPSGRGTADFPVVLDLAGRPCLVVGGGPVAARKARALVAAGARVSVVAVEVDPAVDAIEELAAVGRRPYRAGESAGFDLVVAATGDPAVDGTVVADARAAGVLVNAADGDHPGTVRFPAVLHRGPVTVAVSTGGASPALARWLRDRIADRLPAGLETVAGLVEEARAEWRASGRPSGSVDWATLLDDRVLPLVEAGRIDEARAALRSGGR